MQRIRNINEDLHVLVNGAQKSGTSLSLDASKGELSAVGNYYRVRDGAQSIYNVLKRKIQAPHDCEHRGHGVSLCLERRNINGGPINQRGASTAATCPANPENSSPFRIVFCLAEGKLKDITPSLVPIWKELELVEHFQAKLGDEAEEQHEDEPELGIEQHIHTSLESGPRRAQPLHHPKSTGTERVGIFDLISE